MAHFTLHPFELGFDEAHGVFVHRNALGIGSA